MSELDAVADRGADLLQDVDVRLIRAFAVESRHFEEKRNVLEGALGNDPPEAFAADVALADVLVPVTAAAEVDLRVR